MPGEKPRVIFDCNVFWRAFFSPFGLGNDCIELIRNRNIHHFISRQIIREIREVLLRPQKFATPPDRSIAVARFIREVIANSTLVKWVPEKFVLERDAKDTPYLDLALETQIDYLVTTDRDLLDLMTGTNLESKEIRQRLRNTKIIRPALFATIMRDRLQRF
jgi:putative PIN family toxin of toxin-antitoxin system